MPIDKNIEDLELNDFDTDTLAIEDENDVSPLDDIDLNLEEINTDLNEENQDTINQIDQYEDSKEDTILLSENKDIGEEETNLGDNLEDEKIKIDSDIDLNLDLDSTLQDFNEENITDTVKSDNNEELTEELNEDIDLSLEESFKEIDNDITESYGDSNINDLDIKSDLGLQDELSLSIDENSDIDNNFDLDITDDTGNKIDASEEEFGVDLKSGPVTIDFFDQKEDIVEENLLDNEIIDFDELDEKMAKDDTVINLNIPEKKPLVIDEEQSKYLQEEVSEEIAKEEELEKDLEKNFKDIEEELSEFKIEEDIDNLSLESLEEEALRTSESMVSDEEIQNLEKESELDLSLDNIDNNEVEEAILAEEEISLDNKLEDNENIEDIQEEKLENFDNVDYEVELNTAEIEGNKKIEDIKESGDMEEISPEEEKIVLDETELSEVEEVIFPDEKNMPELDEDIKNIGLKDSNLGDTISPLTDTKAVFSEELGDEESLDLSSQIEEPAEEIKEETLEEELEEESLSPTELENIISTTELIETSAESVSENEENIDLGITEDLELEKLESDIDMNGIDIKEEPITIDETSTQLEESETIDLSNFEADLIDTNQEEVQTLTISKEEEEDIYNSLRNEMMSKKNKESEPQELKEQVKVVLSYLDQLLDALPEEKIKEFAESKTFEIYRKLFEELNIKS